MPHSEQVGAPSCASRGDVLTGSLVLKGVGIATVVGINDPAITVPSAGGIPFNFR
jgi:hypothetical protein